ncbi:MFS transporter [Acidiphilium sp. AL]|uniref:MFS transporter n=1 Tax=Acidiphilium sp. AL TaxID=2871704 RepID=UPI0021CB7462|nr:MFS transporter [Acidiphilium sp. AL]MCU4161939.1 MFS transporter [Acidiphilium sp. AL]
MKHDTSFDSMDASPMNAFHRKITFLSGMGVFLEGYDFTNIASALIFLIPYFHLRPTQIGLIATSTYVGTIAGAVSVGYLADRFGRKFMFLTDITLYAIFALLSAFSMSFTMLVIARIGLGFAIGADQALSFTIIAEFAPRKSRGKLNASTWVMWTVASASAYFLSFILNPILHQETWRVLFGISVIPSIIVLYGRSSIPESPRWLVRQGRLDEARDAMETAVPGGAKNLNTAARSKKSVNLGSLFRSKEQTFGTLYIFFMWFCVTFNTYGVGYFTPFILKTLGFTAERSLLGGAIVSLFAISGSIIMFLSVERVGRKFLATMGFSLLAAIDLGLAIASHSRIFTILLILFSLFQFVVWIGPAGLVGVVAPEVFPTDIRSFGTGIAAGLGRLGAIIGILLFPLMMKFGGLQFAMVIFCLDAIIAAGAMIVFGRETKGLALE